MGFSTTHLIIFLVIINDICFLNYFFWWFGY